MRPLPTPSDLAVPRSNEEYLGGEMARINERIGRFVDLKEQKSPPEAYHALAQDLLKSRSSVIAKRREAVAAGVSIPFDGIAARYGLSPEQEEVLWLCLAPHLSSAVFASLVYAQGSALKNFLEVGFVSELVHPSPTLLTARSLFDQHSALVQNGLLVLEATSETGPHVPLLAHAVQAPHYLAAAVMGLSLLDERLAGLCEVIEARHELFDVIVSSETRRQIDELVRNFARKSHGQLELGSHRWTVLVSGPRRSGKTTIAEGFARALRKPLFLIQIPALARKAQADSLLRLAASNAAFLEAVLVLVEPEGLSASEGALMGTTGTLGRVMGSYPGLLVVEPRDADRLPVAFETLVDFIIEIERTEADDRVQMWEALMPPHVALESDVDLMQLASSYALTGGQIENAITWADRRARARGAAVGHEDLDAGAKSQVRTRVSNLTDASKIQLTLKDLVLPERPMSLVNELLDACRCRLRVLNEWGFGKRLVTGKGLVALFTGEPGTGKTLCAEILARELDLRLRIVSVPQIMSKWVGETEKNIRDLFNQGSAQTGMLLFDEADSLFSSRVKVEKSQDHFQNIEVNMLLQEVERFEGIVILTTNLETNIDRAMERRILFKVDFPSPEAPERERIWRTLLPEQAPIEDEIDFGLLAEEFELTGGQIKNAIIRAAYECFAASHGLTQRAMEGAAARQAKAAGKLTRPLDDR